MVDNSKRIDELKKELARDPRSRQFYQLGELLRRDGRLGEAAEALRGGLKHHVRYVAAWVALGRTCLDLGHGRESEAADALSQALGLDAQNPVAWRLLGEARLACGQRTAALEALERALALVPGDEVLKAAVEALQAESERAMVVTPRPAPAPAPPPAPDQPSFVFEAAPLEIEEGAGAAFELATQAVAEVTPPEAAPPAQALPGLEPPPDLVPAEEVEVVTTAPEAPPEEPSLLEAVPAEPSGDVFPVAPEVEAGHEAVPVSGAAAGPPEVAWAAPAVVPEEAFEPEAAAGPGVPPAGEPPIPEVGGEPQGAPAVAAAGEAPTREETTAVPEAEPEGGLLADKMAGEPAGEVVVQAVPPPVDDRPPATLTMARLYLRQQQMGDAVTVLEQLLQREPGNHEARDLLLLIRDMMEESPAPVVPSLTPQERRIAALQRWLARVEQGRERMAP